MLYSGVNTLFLLLMHSAHIFTCTHSFTHHAMGCTLSHLPVVQSGNFSI